MPTAATQKARQAGETRDVRTLEVSPSVARQLLKLNVGNRPVDQDKVNAIAAAQKGGTFRRRKPIVLTNNLLTDGQHTLLGIVKSGVTIPLQVERRKLPAAANGLFAAEDVKKAQRVRSADWMRGALAVVKATGKRGRVIHAIRARDGVYFELEPERGKNRIAARVDEVEFPELPKKQNGLFNKLKEKLTTYVYSVSATKKECRDKRVKLGKVRAKDSDAALELIRDRLKKAGTLELYDKFELSGKRVKVAGGDRQKAARAEAPDKGQKKEEKKESMFYVAFTNKGGDTSEFDIPAPSKERAKIEALKILRRDNEPLKGGKWTIERANGQLANLSGFRDRRGVFHPFRQSPDYNEFLSGDLFPRDRRVPDEQLSLSQFVRRQGGIKPDRDGDNLGEWKMLKEAGRGLATQGARAKSAGRMSESAIEAGFPVEYDSPDFISLVIGDAAGSKKIWSHAKDWGEFADDRGNLVNAIMGGVAGGLSSAVADRYLRWKLDQKTKFGRRPNGAASYLEFFISQLATEEMRRYARAYADYRGKGKARPSADDYKLASKIARLIREGVDYSLMNVPLEPPPELKGNCDPRPAGSSGRARPSGSARVRANGEREEIDKLSEIFQGEVTGEERTLPTSIRNDGKLLGRAGDLRFLRLVNRPASCNEAAARLDYFTPEKVRYHLCNKCGIRFDPASSMVTFGADEKLYFVGEGVRLQQPTEAERPDDLVNYGKVDLIGYDTAKAHLNGGGFYTYVHPFAEITKKVSDLPELYVDASGWPLLVGDAYSISSHGIVN